MAFLSAKVLHPTDMVVVATTGKAMGMDEMMRQTAKARASRGGVPLYRRYMRMTVVVHMDQVTTTLMIERMTCSMCGSSPLTAMMSAAVFPKKVLAPVAATMASDSPRTTMDPILATIPSLKVAGSDSPVMAAWSTEIAGPAHSRQSAGTAA
eukprot:CAMPEP_0172616318 /NCGR_PEP_ID=MMETSP1068-20121228/63690_1 /TAXON_ID=35684 /ORGANISM="Pseudopedinella elastica, Strain CCMP716" /LENGTH=151 /DNA_ID=CAMNT_0013421711 /DNA_START=22 /DNA_END=473 /DNA_ORIENTATION=-